MKHFVIGPVDEDLISTHFLCECVSLDCEGCYSYEAERISAETLEELFVLAGIFKSKGQARKNNFSGEIPEGINMLGTKKKKFWVWNYIENPRHS